MNASASELFGEMVKKDLPSAYLQAMGLCHDPHEAWDITMETYRKAWAALPDFRGSAAFSTWRYRILRNVFIDLRRKPRVLPFKESFPEEDLEPAAAPEPVAVGDDPAEAFARSEEAASAGARVRRALSLLNPVYRTLLKLMDMRSPRPEEGRLQRRKSRRGSPGSCGRGTPSTSRSSTPASRS